MPQSRPASVSDVPVRLCAVLVPTSLPLTVLKFVGGSHHLFHYHYSPFSSVCLYMRPFQPCYSFLIEFSNDSPFLLLSLSSPLCCSAVMRFCRIPVSPSSQPMRPA